MQYKLANGSEIEKKLYKGMSQYDLVARLIVKRCLHFVQEHDYTVLRNGINSHDANLRAEWLRVGTGEEYKNEWIKLEDYLSYDEMMLASLLGVSSPAFFINSGTRGNKAQLEPVVPHQTRGIITGLVGARLAKPGQMDHALLLPPVNEQRHNTRQQDPGMTKVFRDFFGGYDAGPNFNVGQPMAKRVHQRSLRPRKPHSVLCTYLNFVAVIEMRQAAAEVVQASALSMFSEQRYGSIALQR